MADEPNTPPADDPANPPADPPAGDPPANDPPAGDPPADKGGTVLDDAAGGDDGKKPVVPADFPADWREKLAGDDKKFLNILKRYSSPNTFANAYKSLRQKQDSGELKAPLPKDASDEQKAAWRKENGVPEKADGYDLGGLKIDDADKPAVDAYLAAMHEDGATPDQVRKNLSVYYKLKADAAEELSGRDAKDKAETEDALRAEYGNDYRRNMLAGMTLLDDAPEGVKENLLGARLADGTLFANNAKALAWLVQTSLEMNPAVTLVPSGGTDTLKSIAERRAEISKMRRENPEAYYKNEAVQQEERDLIDAETRLKQRNAA